MRMVGGMTLLLPFVILSRIGTNILFVLTPCLLHSSPAPFVRFFMMSEETCTGTSTLYSLLLVIEVEYIYIYIYKPFLYTTPLHPL